MKFRWESGLCLLLTLLLAGCFQPASEAFQPANNTVEPLPVNIPNTPGSDQTTPIQDTPTLFPATSTLPITVISPPTRGAVSPTSQQAPATTTSETNINPTETPQFITPGGPPLPVPTNTPAPTIAFTSSGPSTPSGLITPTALSNGSADGCAYVVQPGDNLYRISVNNNTTVEDMRAANPNLVGDPPILQPGEVLQIPGCAAGSTTTQIAAPTAGSEPGGTTVTGGTVYTVQSGDTLFAIARRFGVTVEAIVNANNLTNPDALSVGQQIVIPPVS